MSRVDERKEEHTFSLFFGRKCVLCYPDFGRPSGPSEKEVSRTKITIEVDASTLILLVLILLALSAIR